MYVFIYIYIYISYIAAGATFLVADKKFQMYNYISH